MRTYFFPAIAMVGLTASITLSTSSLASTLSSRNLYASNDALITYDSSTNFEWLDLTETQGKSYSDVLSATVAGGEYEGWHVATNTDVYALWSNADIASIDFSFSAANYAPVNDLLDLIGTTYYDPVVPDYRLSWAYTSDSDLSGYVNLTLLWETSYYRGPEGMAAINTNPQHWPEDVSAVTHATYLYREGVSGPPYGPPPFTPPDGPPYGPPPHAHVVPIPAAAFMFAPALLGFMGLRRRAKSKAV